MANLSNFPESVDSFLRHDDINTSDTANLNTLLELKKSQSLTSSQYDVMQSLLTTLRNKLWLAEDFNKIQDTIINLQTFFISTVRSYVATLFNQYDVRFSAMIGKVQQKVFEINNTVVNTDAWFNKISTEVQNSTYFNFDNYAYMSGYRIEVEKITDTVTVENIVNSVNGELFATRRSEKDASGNWSTRTTCYYVYPPVDFTERAVNNGNGNWVTTVINHITV